MAKHHAQDQRTGHDNGLTAAPKTRSNARAHGSESDAIDSASSPNADFATRLTLYKDIADVTWRMFVPSVGGAVLGVILDRMLHTKPLCTIIGITLGFAVVVFLVWQQINATKVQK